MKRCPQCKGIATDETLIFCRVDGSRFDYDNDSFNDRDTVVLHSDGLLRLDNSSNLPVAPTTLIALPKAATPTHKLVTGNHRLIAVAAIAALTILMIVTVAAFYSFSPKNSAPIYSLAVLPFINVNADQQLEYLSDGMTEMLICDLSQLPKLNVKARSSVFRYKGKDVTPHTVGTDLNVQAVLNGRITQRGDVMTLILELADSRTENIIWSGQYSRRPGDLLSLQSEIARDVASNLRAKLAGVDEQKVSKNYTINTEAYHLYLKGRFYWNKRTLKDLEKALEYFNQAIVFDPNYALAYAGLADTYVVLPFYRNGPVREAMPRAQEAAMKALLLDGNLAEPHAALGHIYTHEYNFAKAEKEYKRAIELKPNYATAHQWYGILLFYLSRYEEAIAELQQALELDPLSLIINLDYAESLFYARRYDDAIAQLKKTLELNSEFATTQQRLTKFYQANENYAEAVQSFATYRELTGDRKSAALLRENFAKGGWQGFLRTITATEQLGKLSRYETVIFYVALGEKEKAFAELNNSYEVFGPLLRIEPLLDPLRDDPRFAEILQRAGLSQE